MKNSKTLLMLAATLTIGAASADTVAGTAIVNTATASFTDPTNPSQEKKVTSNTVTTLVSAVPDFTITPNDGGTLGQPDPTNPGQVKNGVKPGEEVEFDYTISNTGNTPVVVQLDPKDADATAKNSTKSANAVENLTYYVKDGQGGLTKLTDSNGDGLVEVPELDAGAQIEIVQKYTVPSNAAGTDTYGANPVGTALYDGDVTNGTAVGDLNANSDVAVVTDAKGSKKVDKNNFNQVSLIKPNVDNTPPASPKDPDGDGTPGTPSNPGNTNGKTVVPPSNPGSNPADPNKDNGTVNNPVSPNSSPQDPDVPVKDGYQDPNGTPIEVDLAGNKQVAYPPADADNQSDSVTFYNELTNNGSQSDQVTVFPVESNGNNVEIDGLTDEDSSAPGIQVTLQPNQTINYTTTVTYPDNDNSDTPRDDITTVIGVDSGNDGDVYDGTNGKAVKDATTTNIIKPPSMQFGDHTPALGAAPNPTPTQVVDPTKPDSTNPLDTTTLDGTASFPMDVVNTGAYNDTYTLSGSVPGIPNAEVAYYDQNGNELPTNAAGEYITPVVGAGEELKVNAVVTNIPNDTAAGDYTLEQTAEANYSGITLTDNNDIIKVQPSGDFAFAKFTKGGNGATSYDGIQAPAGYTTGENQVAPGKTINYVIKAQNRYNAPVENFAVCDTVPNNTILQDISDNDGVNNIYRVGGGAWTNSAPGNLAAGTEVCIANDANGDMVPDNLPQGETYTVNFAAEVE